MNMCFKNPELQCTYACLTIKMAACTFEEKLINAVYLRQFIYDKTKPDHCRRQKVAAAWVDIGEETGGTAIRCKNRWRSLKDRFKQLYDKQMKQPSGSGDVEDSSSWIYYKLLLFLTDHVQSRKVVDTLAGDSVEVVNESGELTVLPILHVGETSSQSTTPTPCQDRETPPSRKRCKIGEPAAAHAIAELASEMKKQSEQDRELLQPMLKPSPQEKFLAYLDDEMNNIKADTVADLRLEILKLVAMWRNENTTVEDLEMNSD